MNPVTLARASAVARLGFGVALLAAPQRLIAPWIGADGRRSGPQALARALGTRDLALGAGALAAAGAAERRRWLLAALVSDATDLTVSLAAGGLPARGRALGALAAGGGVAMGAVAVAKL